MSWIVNAEVGNKYLAKVSKGVGAVLKTNLHTYRSARIRQMVLSLS